MYHNLYYYILKERDKLIMSVNIDDIEYNYEDEELDNIEYLEIMSLDDIIKDNPSFIALSRKDIKDSLFELFVNNKKADDITNLFYNILNDIEDNRGKLKNYDNYIYLDSDILFLEDPQDLFLEIEKDQFGDFYSFL